MNLLLLNQDDFLNPSEVKIQGRQFNHLKKIIKVTIDQEIDLGVIGGQLGKGKVTEIGETSLRLSVTLNQAPPAEMPITLILALPRPLMLKRILQTITAMGIKNIHLINSQRVEKSYWGSSDMADDVIHQQFILGLEQARDTVLPTLFLHKNFKRFVANELPIIIANKQALLAHLGNYPPCPGNIHDPVVLMVGPEGGFIPEEVNVLIQTGFQTVQIGSRSLRVEAAVTALVGRLLPI